MSKKSVIWLIVGLCASMIFLAALLAIVGAVSNSAGSGNVAHIKIRGLITTEQESMLGGSTASAEDVAANVRKADSNPAISAILIDINSPGGSAVASEELARAVGQAEKPVVALIRDVGASGAYWVASSSDVIVASPLSITGGVGATASYLEFSGLFERYGIGYRRVVSGEFKDVGTPFKNATDDEELLLQQMIEFTGDYFASSVQKNRGLSDEVADSISSGRIYTGQQAKAINLVDELGNMDAAEQEIIKMIGVDELRFIEYEVKQPFSLRGILSQNAEILGRSIGASLLPRSQMISLS